MKHNINHEFTFLPCKHLIMAIAGIGNNGGIGTLQALVVALCAGLAVWGVINLLEGYGNDNPGAKSQGMKHYIPK